MKAEIYKIDRDKALSIVKGCQGIRIGELCESFSAGTDTVRRQLREMAAEGLLFNELKLGGVSRWYTPDHVEKYGLRTSSKPRDKKSGTMQPEETEMLRMSNLANSLMRPRV